ncbi:MAG: methyltransferase [Alphaproteobacteria bacterium]|jgi:tRNA (cmo5U34)-methyltransferase
MDIPREWTFENTKVASGFDRHVREQLPWYDLVTGAVAHIARHYIPRNGLVYDIGASTGNIGQAIEETIVERKAKLVGIEASAEMCARYKAPGELVQIDALDYRFQPYDLAICYLVLMFLPVGKRQEFIDYLKSLIKPGGALLIVDKCEAATGYEATVFWRLTLAGKIAAGVDAESVIAKELSLSGVQRPLDPAMLGDDAVQWFRFGDFAGWIVTK